MGVLQTPMMARTLWTVLFAGMTCLQPVIAPHLLTDGAPLFGTLSPRAGEPVVVMAAHPDDDLLAAAPFLMASGRRATVVLATEGDGFPAATLLARGVLPVRPKDYEAVGKVRRGEETAALRSLAGSRGLPRVVWLGFSDQGLWPSFISASGHASPYTGDRTTEGATRGRRQSQNRQSLLTAVERAIVRAQPAVVLAPHPADTHPDHRALGAVTELAVADLTHAGRLPARTKVFRYLVHRRAWPLPKGAHPDMALRPPASLTTLGPWYAVPQGRVVTQRMQRAIRCHRTQTRLLNPILLAFVRRNSLLASLATPRLPPGGRRFLAEPAPAQAGASRPGVLVRRTKDGRQLHLWLAGEAPAGGRSFIFRLWRTGRQGSSLVTRRVAVPEATFPVQGGAVLVAVEVRQVDREVSSTLPRVLTLT